MNNMSELTWKSLLEEEMDRFGDDINNIISTTFGGEDINAPVYVHYGDVPAFTVWTSERVYFPCGYDGAYSINSVSRNPDGIKTILIGGGC